MQRNSIEQCLADLYFEVVFEQLQRKRTGTSGGKKSPAHIIRLIKSIKEVFIYIKIF